MVDRPARVDRLEGNKRGRGVDGGKRCHGGASREKDRRRRPTGPYVAYAQIGKVRGVGALKSAGQLIRAGARRLALNQSQNSEKRCAQTLSHHARDPRTLVGWPISVSMAFSTPGSSKCLADRLASKNGAFARWSEWDRRWIALVNHHHHPAGPVGDRSTPLSGPE